jgi:hypothetical protein
MLVDHRTFEPKAGTVREFLAHAEIDGPVLKPHVGNAVACVTANEAAHFSSDEKFHRPHQASRCDGSCFRRTGYLQKSRE